MNNYSIHIVPSQNFSSSNSNSSSSASVASNTGKKASNNEFKQWKSIKMVIPAFVRFGLNTTIFQWDTSTASDRKVTNFDMIFYQLYSK